MHKRAYGLAVVLMAGLVGGCVGVGVSHVSTAQAADTARSQSVTVFVDATFGFRKNHMAKKITESNAKYEAKGYRYTDMAAYTENGDLEGFFVTYTRD